MKVPERVLDVQGGVSGEKIGMVIDQSALAHIMSVLTDLYSDPEAAVLREYSTNALDSHREAGQTRPIEVTLPSQLSPFLRIRDFGTGLDADGIRDIYSRYGTSTKRDSNDVVGMLGLGCKSALTYADQFTLTGIKDGRMIQVLIGRDEDGAGSMTIVAEHDTTDLDGVEVTIPAKRHHSFESKAEHFFRFWTKGTVLVNGEEPTRVDGQWITDRILITEEVDQDYVVMGNVAYPVEGNTLTGREQRAYYRRDWTVCFVDIGEVQFTPSREALQMTKLTRDKLDALKVERDTKLDASLQANIANAATAAEAIELWQSGRRISPALKATYKGHEVSTELFRLVPGKFDYRNQPVRQENAYLVATPGRNSRYRVSGSWQSTIGIEKGNVFFEGFDGATLTNVKRAKIDYYFDNNGGLPEGTVRYVFIPGKLTKHERFWLDGAKVYQWADFEAIKLPRDPSTKTAGPRGAYKGRTPDGDWSRPIMAATIDTNKPVLFYRGNRWGFQQTVEYRRNMIPDDVLVVCLEENRVQKFLRDFPMAVSVAQYARDWVAKQVAAWDKGLLKAANFQRLQGVHKLKQLPVTQLRDPELREAITLLNTDAATIMSQLSDWMNWLPDAADLTKLPDNPLDKYPLMQHQPSTLDGTLAEHAVTYLNAAYAADRS